MQEELKRCNYLGSLNSIFLFAKIAISDHPTDLKSIISRSSLDSHINIKAKPCVQFFTALKYIVINEADYVASERGMHLTSLDYDDFCREISEDTLAFLISEGLITNNAILYDYQHEVCRIKRSGFSFSAAVMRNLLLETGAITENAPSIFDVDKAYESLFETCIKKQRGKMTLEQLMEIHQKQEQQGRQAEEYVLEFEKRRLLWCKVTERIKQISDFDVSAGYDIISFSTEESKTYDRFIEVKSYSSRQSFFWSSNELKTAREIGDKYYLYLVDMEQYQTIGYEPTIIQNPANCIINSEEWLIEASSLKITKV